MAGIPNRIPRWLVVAAALVGACGGGERQEKPDADEAGKKPEGAEAKSGQVIVITATTDDKGNYYSPAEVTAHAGDILRFTLGVGVHNAHFVPDSNPGKTGLPPASDMLQLPGQTIDIPLTFGEGTFYFQCDPHAALGMKGKVTVKD